MEAPPFLGAAQGPWSPAIQNATAAAVAEEMRMATEPSRVPQDRSVSVSSAPIPMIATVMTTAETMRPMRRAVITRGVTGISPALKAATSTIEATVHIPVVRLAPWQAAANQASAVAPTRVPPQAPSAGATSEHAAASSSIREPTSLTKRRVPRGMRRSSVRTMGKPRKVPRSFEMPWGKGQVVEEVGVDTEHDSELVIQLLEYDDFDQPTLRFCQYWADGRFQRQPMMLPSQHIADLRKAVAGSPRIKALLKELVD